MYGMVWYGMVWNEFLSVFDSYDGELCVRHDARGQGTLNVTHTKTVAISKIEMQSGETDKHKRIGHDMKVSQSCQICGKT